MSGLFRVRLVFQPVASRAALTGVAMLAAASHVIACPICFQVEQGPVTEGVHAAVIVLVGVTVSVLSGFGFFIRRFVRAARHIEAGASSASDF